MTEVQLVNGRRLHLTAVDDSDEDVLFGVNTRGRRIWLVRAQIKALR